MLTSDATNGDSQASIQKKREHEVALHSIVSTEARLEMRLGKTIQS